MIAYGHDWRGYDRARTVRCQWSLVTPPVIDPLSMTDTKLHISATQDDENALTLAYLAAATESAQQFMNRALVTQTWQLQASEWADTFWLPMAAPLQTVSSVKYYATDGTLTTLDPSYYLADTVSEPGAVRRAVNQAWPALQSDRDFPVVIAYVAGWATQAAIPELIKQGIRLHVAASDADRTGGMAESIAARRAAEAMWTMAGCVYWREPQLCRR